MNRRLLLGAGAGAVLTALGTLLARRRTAPAPANASATSPVQAGLLAGRIPFVRGGSGPLQAVVFAGGNALFKRLDDTAEPARHARQIERLLPGGWRYTILGYEDVPPADYTIDTIVHDLAGVVRGEMGKPDLVIGISFGGFVAQRFAADHPDLVDRLVLLVSGHRFSDEGWAAMRRQVTALERGDLYSLVTDGVLLFRRPWYNGLARLKLWWDRERLSRDLKDPKLILRTYRSLFADDFSRNASYARRIQAPTLVLGGTADQLFGGEVFKETAALIPNARVQLIEGETHMVPIERSADVAGIIGRFLRHGWDPS